MLMLTYSSYDKVSNKLKGGGVIIEETPDKVLDRLGVEERTEYDDNCFITDITIENIELLNLTK
jgi:hypothetical protein